MLHKLNLEWLGEMYTDNSISILYGRLNAPNDKYKVNWNSEECYCWHRLSGTGAVFDILDGLSPQESAKRTGFSQLINSLRQSELWQSLAWKRRDPELLIRMESAIWDYYGLPLVELFDLRRLELWEQCRRFLKEVYDIKGRSPNIKPPLDCICKFVVYFMSFLYPNYCCSRCQQTQEWIQSG